MRDFRTLGVWRKSHQLTLEVYHATNSFPNHELYGLTSQIRRASASIPTNLAEGCGRDTEGDLRRFVDIAAGSACEVEYQLLLARDLGYLDEETHTALDTRVNEIKKMLAGFGKRLRQDS